MPLIGISLIAWPVGILLIISGNVFRGVFIIAAVFGVAQIETVLRPRLVPKGAQLNPALVILSVLGGLGVMGIVGALYGPVVMILLVTSIDVYTKYLLRSDLEILDQQGRIDLVALGLKTEDRKADPNIGIMLVIDVKNISTRLRKEESKPISNSEASNQEGF